MKKLTALLLCLAMVLIMLSGCNVKTKDDVKGPDTSSNGNSASNAADTKRDPIPITLLSLSSLETETNVVRDQLKKAGFDVTLSIQPDYGSLSTQIDARNYDIYMGTMKVLAGNPDYDLGASQLPQDYQETYAELERLVVEGKAYFAPICRTMSCYGFNKNVIKEDTVTIGQSKYLYWSQLDYVDESLRETRPLVVANERILGQFDPPTTDGTHRVLANTNIKLLELDEQDNIVTDRALAYNYSIAEGNSVFYFVLRDNVGFYTAKNGELVDTGEKVGAEDVIFTYDRLRTPDSVPGNQVYDNYACLKELGTVTDLSELENAKDAVSGKSVKEVLEAGLPAPISELVDDKNATDNAGGKYDGYSLPADPELPVRLLLRYPQQEAGFRHQHARTAGQL